MSFNEKQMHKSMQQVLPLSELLIIFKKMVYVELINIIDFINEMRFLQKKLMK